MHYVFGAYHLDTQRYELHHAGVLVPLRPKVFQVLAYLVAQHERVVGKEELLEALWPGQFVGDVGLNTYIMEVRKALGDRRPPHQYLRTVRGHGYRFVAPVEARDQAPPPSPRPAGPLPVKDYEPALAYGQRAHAIMTTLGEDAREAEAPAPPAGSAWHRAITEAVEWKVVTVLCGALAETPPGSGPQEPDIHYRHLREFYAVARTAVERYGGTLQPLVGDHVLAVFGAPVAQEDHASRAVLAALELLRLRRDASSMAVCLGLHTGQVAIGRLEDVPAIAGAVVGNAVTLAMALRAQAAPGTILCSAATARLVQGVVRVAEAGNIAFGGEPAPLPTYMVIGSRVRYRPIGLRERRAWTPFVGRQRELVALQALFAQVQKGLGQVVGIMGEPGLGKSRLVYEFHRCLRGQPMTYLASGCFAHSAASPYFPVLALLRHLWGLSAWDPLTASAAKVQVHLQQAGLAPERWAPYLLHLLGVAGGDGELAGLSPQAIKSRIIEALVVLVLQGARQRPLVLEVENLHWIDPSSEEVLAALVEQVTGVRLLLLLTYRPGYRPSWMDKSYATQLALTGLGPRDSRRVVHTIVRSVGVPEAVIDSILARAAGNPLFLEELAHTVVEQDTQHPPEAVPATLQAVLAARIDQLPPEAKHVLQLGAVIGTQVPIALLEASAEVPEAVGQGGLARLQAAELCYEMRGAERMVSFKHVLIRDAAYQSLVGSTRQAYHQRIAQVLVAQFPETVAMHPELLARHYTEAGLQADALPYWHQAGQRAIARSAYAEALHHLTTGLVLLAMLPETPARAQEELDLQMALGPAVMATKGTANPEVEQTYARARALCQQVGDTPQLFQTLWGLCRFYRGQGTLLTARELGEQLDRLAERAADPMQRLEAHDALGTTLFYLGDYAAARTHVEQGMALTDPTTQRAQALRQGEASGLRCLGVAAQALWCLGYPQQAVQRSQEALALAQRLAHPYSLAAARHWATSLHYRRGEVLAVQTQAEALLALATAQEFPVWVGHGTCWRGWALAMQSEGAASLPQIRQGMAAVLATGQALFQPLHLVLLAETAGYVGQVEDGLCLLTEALTMMEANRQGDMLPEAYRLHGALLLRQSVPDALQAEVCFQKALTIARRQQAKSWELRAAMSLARLWQRQGKRTEAYDLLTPLYSWFTEGFDTADLQDAKALLEALA